MRGGRRPEGVYAAEHTAYLEPQTHLGSQALTLIQSIPRRDPLPGPLRRPGDYKEVFASLGLLHQLPSANII